MVPPKKNTSLAHWQEDFTTSLFSGLSHSLAESIHEISPRARQQRFNIYQNNVFYSLTSALADLYPVIKQLVGDDFFNGTANFYLREHPPAQAAMVHFGQDFPMFLERFEHTRDMAYLAPVARLELARQNAYHAADSEPLSAETIARLDPNTLASARLMFHPSLQLLESQYPIFNIWQANQNDSDDVENIDLNEPQQVLIVRPEYDVCMYNMDAISHQFFSDLLEGTSLHQVIENTLIVHSDFNPASIINFIVQEKLLTGIHHHEQ